MSGVDTAHRYANAKSADGACLIVGKASQLLVPLILQQVRTRERWRVDCPLEKTSHTDNHLKDVNKGFSLSIYLNG